jgi:hypothetical protein
MTRQQVISHDAVRTARMPHLRIPTTPVQRRQPITQHRRLTLIGRLLTEPIFPTNFSTRSSTFGMKASITFNRSARTVGSIPVPRNVT